MAIKNDSNTGLVLKMFQVKISSLKRSKDLSTTISILSQDVLTDAQLMLMDAQLMLMDAQLMLLDAQLMCVRVRMKLTQSS